jgi:hypothetical protein
MGLPETCEQDITDCLEFSIHSKGTPFTGMSGIDDAKSLMSKNEWLRNYKNLEAVWVLFHNMIGSVIFNGFVD